METSEAGAGLGSSVSSAVPDAVAQKIAAGIVCAACTGGIDDDGQRRTTLLEAFDDGFKGKNASIEWENASIEWNCADAPDELIIAYFTKKARGIAPLA